MTRDLARRDSSRGETPPDKRLLARQETPLELAFSVNHFFFLVRHLELNISFREAW